MDGPPIAAGEGLTVTVANALQPEPIVYDIIAVPAITPVTMPVPVPTVATPVLLLLHRPPAVTSNKATLAPSHITLVPVIAAGLGLTVTMSVA